MLAERRRSLDTHIMASFVEFPPDSELIRMRLDKIAPHLGFLMVDPNQLTADSPAPYVSLESKARVREVMDALFPEPKRSDPTFDLLEHMANLKGPFIELGGPTPSGFRIADLNDIHRATGKKIQVSNANSQYLEKFVPKPLSKAIEITGYQNAENLKYPDGSIGVVFVSAIGFYAFPGLVAESNRVLQENGLLITGYNSTLEVARALQEGFALRQYESEIYTWPGGFQDRIWHTIFQKA